MDEGNGVSETPTHNSSFCPLFLCSSFSFQIQAEGGRQGKGVAALSPSLLPEAIAFVGLLEGLVLD